MPNGFPAIEINDNSKLKFSFLRSTIKGQSRVTSLHSITLLFTQVYFEENFQEDLRISQLASKFMTSFTNSPKIAFVFTKIVFTNFFKFTCEFQQNWVVSRLKLKSFLNFTTQLFNWLSSFNRVTLISSANVADISCDWN